MPALLIASFATFSAPPEFEPPSVRNLWLAFSSLFLAFPGFSWLFLAFPAAFIGAAQLAAVSAAQPDIVLVPVLLPTNALRRVTPLQPAKAMMNVTLAELAAAVAVAAGYA